jgi:hypothetical protein
MVRHMRHFSNALDGDWNRVSGTTPCPICGGDADCRTHSDEAFVCCVQRPSDWRLNNGGWLHRVQAMPSTLGVGVSARLGDYAGRDFASREAPSGVLP